MERSKSNPRHKWPKEQVNFCLEQYYLNRGVIVVVRRLFCEKFKVKSSDMEGKCPSVEKIKEWVKIEEEKSKHSFKQPEEKKPENKLAGTQWGRKTGENRIVRTESIDTGLQHQSMKWKQRDVKWNGPRPVNEKQKVIVKPVEEKPPCYYWHYQEPVQEEVKPDRKQVIQEKYKENILELVESLDAHGHAARASAFVSLRAALQRRAADGVLGAHRATLADHVARALRRGKDQERKAAAAIAPLLALQIGDEGTEEFIHEVRPALEATATDKSASLDTRTEDDGTVRVSGEAVDSGAWHAAALDGWALLLPLLSRDHALSLLHNQEPSFARLGEMLEAASLEVRMAAGSALAIAYETVTGDDNSDSELKGQVDDLLPLLTELARDSNKSRSKKDRKIQRATFREILKYFEEGEVPSTMSCARGWRACAAHAALASALGGALHVLAPRAPRLRAALGVGEEPLEEEEKPDKLQRHLQKKASGKSRDFVRGMNRDKRSAVLVS